MKKDQYFNLEVNLLNEDNVAVMMSELDAAQAIGIYVILLLHLRTKDNYEASCSAALLKALSRRYEVDLDVLQRVLHDYDLFEVDEERCTFRSRYLDRVMKRLEERWRTNAENGKKGGRPRKVAKNAETPATKGGKPNETQEKRGEENKSITPVVNNSSNTTPTAAVAVAAAVVVPPAASMKIVLPDKAGDRPLQETLLALLRKQGKKEQTSFESIIDGRRTSMGHIIPPEVPPRPDDSAVWDVVRKRRVHYSARRLASVKPTPCIC